MTSAPPAALLQQERQNNVLVLKEDPREKEERFYLNYYNTYRKKDLEQQEKRGVAVRRNAVARLMKDLKEIHENLLPTIHAEPLEHNVFEWHANLIGTPGTDYEGACFHFILLFPRDYPDSPPKVKPLTRIYRSHVFSEWICLDLLQSWGGFSQKKYTGWTTAYSTLSILLQLQAFLFEPEETSCELIRGSITMAAKFKCSTCAHNMSNSVVWPKHEQMVVPMTTAEVEKKYTAPFKTAFEKEKEIAAQLTKRNLENYNQMFPTVTRGRPRKKNQQQLTLDQQIQKNLEKLKHREKQLFHLRENGLSEKNKNEKELLDPNRYIPGFVTEEKAKKKAKKASKQSSKQLEGNQGEVERRVVSEEPLSDTDRLFLAVWNTHLDPLAKPFILIKVGEEGTSAISLKQQEKVGEQNTHDLMLILPLQANAGLLPSEILSMIFAYLSGHLDISRCKKVCRHWHNVASDAFHWERKQLVCFHTKRTFEEDVLGIGVTLKLHKKSGEVEYISTEMDLMSHTSFYDMGVRKSVWQESFTHFVPVYINHSHGQRALALLERSVRAILSIPKFNPEACLDLYAKLCNTMIVNLMNDSKHASIKALQGYCFFYRTMIAVLEKYPHLNKVIHDRIKNFILKEEYRHKKVVSSLGELLPILALSNYSWKHLATPILREVFTRNVLWVAKQHPECATVTNTYSKASEDARVKKSFKTNLVSLRLMMFHVYFFSNVARPKNMSLRDVAELYDSRYGMPTEQMQHGLQNAIFDIQEVEDYYGFFKFTQLPVPSTRLLHEILRTSVLSSLEKRYHRPFYTRRIAEEPKDKKPTLGRDEYDQYY